MRQDLPKVGGLVIQLGLILISAWRGLILLILECLTVARHSFTTLPTYCDCSQPITCSGRLIGQSNCRDYLFLNDSFNEVQRNRQGLLGFMTSPRRTLQRHLLQLTILTRTTTTNLVTQSLASSFVAAVNGFRTLVPLILVQFTFLMLILRIPACQSPRLTTQLPLPRLVWRIVGDFWQIFSRRSTSTTRATDSGMAYVYDLSSLLPLFQFIP